MTDDIAFLHANAYAGGAAPIDHATWWIAQLIDVHDTVKAGRAKLGPNSYGAYPIAMTTEALASRILGELLNAGWRQPDPITVQGAVAKVRADLEDLTRRAHLPCTCGHQIDTHIDAPGSKCTDCDHCWSWKPIESEAS